MQPIPVTRYQPGGDIYAQFQSQYSTGAADSIAAAAATGDRTQLANAIANAKGNPEMDASTLDAFVTQIETNPLGAPLDSLNGLLSNTFLSFLKNPAVLITVVLVLFLALGGFGWISRRYFKA
jgi:hypothetical protein